LNLDTQQKQQKERVLLVGLYGRDTHRGEAQEHLDELERLADTAGGITISKVLQKRLKPDVGTYIGKGKLKELSRFIKTHNIDLVVFDDDLSATQVRNIQNGTNAKVIDRSALILDIFAFRAKTAAAKVQVELAQLEYVLPRLTRAWTHLSRQKGGIGTKGPGETQIETDRRMIGKRIALLKEKLDKLNKQRITQRKGRSGLTRVALVGYTNAGKSTLMNALTETQLFAEDRLFATLDSTVRKFNVNNRELLLSDTVGFIRKLPHNLIESFKSTLDEIRESDILVHVVDASSGTVDDYIKVVNSTLKEIKADSKPILLVFNKVDAINDNSIIKGLKRDYPDAVWISAERNIGLNNLESEIDRKIIEDSLLKTYEIPVKEYKAVSVIHEIADVLNEEFVDDIVRITFRIPKKYLGELKSVIKHNDFETSVVC
jgi:GTP-binding protein HflX